MLSTRNDGKKTTDEPGKVKSSAVVSDENDWRGHLLEKLDKLSHRAASLYVLHSLSANVHVVPVVHRDIVNVERSRMNRLRRPDVATEQLVAVQRRDLNDVAVQLCTRRRRSLSTRTEQVRQQAC